MNILKFDFTYNKYNKKRTLPDKLTLDIMEFIEKMEIVKITEKNKKFVIIF